MSRQSDAISTYVDELERQRRDPQVETDLKDAALAQLQEVGAVIVPVDDGEWTLRADRDEDGPFIAASFESLP